LAAKEAYTPKILSIYNQKKKTLLLVILKHITYINLMSRDKVIKTIAVNV